MLVGEAAQSGPVGGKVSASRAGQFFASAEAGIPKGEEIGHGDRIEQSVFEFEDAPGLSRRSFQCRTLHRAGDQEVATPKNGVDGDASLLVGERGGEAVRQAGSWLRKHRAPVAA